MLLLSLLFLRQGCVHVCGHACNGLCMEAQDQPFGSALSLHGSGDQTLAMGQGQCQLLYMTCFLYPGNSTEGELLVPPGNHTVGTCDSHGKRSVITPHFSQATLPAPWESQCSDKATTLIGSRSYQFLGDRKPVNQLTIRVHYTIT